MKIISEFKDYYDGVAYDFYDPDLLYVRSLIRENHNRIDFFRQKWFYCDRMTKHTQSVIFVGFCGTIRPCFELTKDRENAGEPSTFCYSLGEISDWYKENFPDKFEEFKANKYSYKWYRDRGWSEEWTFEKYRRRWDQARQACSDSAKIWETTAYPIFVDFHGRPDYWEDKLFAWNYPLREIDFQKVIDPYVTFQELRMWLSNQASPEKYVPEMDNATKIQQHGFDLKESFRKSKS